MNEGVVQHVADNTRLLSALVHCTLLTTETPCNDIYKYLESCKQTAQAQLDRLMRFIPT